MTSNSNPKAAVVEVTAADLPLYCPNPSMPIWSTHPRVFLDFLEKGEAMCPYCGTRYHLSGGRVDGGHGSGGGH